MQPTIEDILIFEEGYRDEPYLDSLGYITIGIGHKLYNKLDADPKDFNLTMTTEEAISRLKDELDDLTWSLIESSIYTNLNRPRQMMLQSMAYQMGISGLYNFKKMWKALEVEDYTTAWKEALDSKWAKQTPERATRHAQVLLSGTLDVYKDLV